MYKGKKVTQIMAVSKDGFIGDGNSIPWRCRKDMLHFAAYTKGKVCIMGRKTFDSINPPLKGRVVIVVTSNSEVSKKLTEVPHHLGVSTIEEALDIATTISLGEEIMIVGGKTIYQQTLPHTDRLLISTINIELGSGDTAFDWGIPDTVEIVSFDFEVDDINVSSK